MKLIIGGAYQGKREFVQNTWGVEDKDIFTCSNMEIDFTKPCIDRVEEFTYACVQAKIDPTAFFKENRDRWQRSVIICQDLSCGVVPLGADLRAWRQETGILCQYLAKEAESVSRIFCGLEQRLK